jgi:hypothetical protein
MFLDRGMPLIEGEVYERCGGWGVPGPNDKKTETPMAAGTPLDMMPGGKYYEKEKKEEKADTGEGKSAKMHEEFAGRFNALEQAVANRREQSIINVNLPDSIDLKPPTIINQVPEQRIIIQPPERVFVPSPVVTNRIEAPIIPPAQVTVQAPEVNVKFEDAKSVSALERIGSLLERAVSFFSLGKGKKTTTVKKRDAQGNIQEFETREE